MAPTEADDVAVWEAEREEIAMYRRHSDYDGYAFLVVAAA
jgi:hypothetical protein